MHRSFLAQIVTETVSGVTLSFTLSVFLSLCGKRVEFVMMPISVLVERVSVLSCLIFWLDLFETSMVDMVMALEECVIRFWFEMCFNTKSFMTPSTFGFSLIKIRF